jgi:nickel superoxide dismutase
MTMIDRVFRAVDQISPPRRAEAHCDVPCGIYDPHAAQIAALTVIRMNQLQEALQQPAGGASKAEQDAYSQTLGRYIQTKEEHARIAEQELTILWTDYFKPEHTEKHANLGDLIWKTSKLTSTVKQQWNMQAAQDLLSGVQQVAEIFWDTKGVKTKRQPSGQPTGGDLVVPVTA